MEALKDFFKNQPTDYQEPTRVQKWQAQWEQALTPRQRKVAKIAIPIFIVILSIGAGVGAAFVAPAGWDKVVGTAIMLNVSGLAIGGYQFATWRWGKSYFEQMAKINDKEEKSELKKWKEKLEWFKAHQQWFKDFDSAHLEKTKDPQLVRLMKIGQLLENCPQARSVNLHTEFDALLVLPKLERMKHVKRLTIDFSENNGNQRSEQDRIDLIQYFPENLRHINLNMPPPEQPKAGENLDQLKPVKLSEAFFKALVARCPNLKTIQTTHMDNDAWKHFGDLKKIREITVEMDTLKTLTESQAEGMISIRNKILNNKVRFKQIRIIHPKWDEAKKYAEYDEINRKIKENILEEKGHFDLDDQDGQDDKRTLSIHFSWTLAERWEFVKDFFRGKKAAAAAAPPASGPVISSID